MMNFIKFREVLFWLLRGKTITRSLLNVRLSHQVELNGLTLDLGGGGEPTYKKTLKINGQFVNMDAIAEANPTVIGNIEKRLPFQDNYADNVILFNTLEHVFDHKHVISEMHRVLKYRGISLIYVPFLFPIHTHQTKNFFVDDYFRYSKSGLKRLFEDAGFSDVRIESLGGIFLVVGEFLSMVVPFRIFKLPIYFVFFGLEKVYLLFKPNISSDRFPLGYFITAKKYEK